MWRKYSMQAQCNCGSAGCSGRARHSGAIPKPPSLQSTLCPKLAGNGDKGLLYKIAWMLCTPTQQACLLQHCIASVIDQKALDKGRDLPIAH